MEKDQNGYDQATLSHDQFRRHSCNAYTNVQKVGVSKIKK